MNLVFTQLSIFYAIKRDSIDPDTLKKKDATRDSSMKVGANTLLTIFFSILHMKMTNFPTKMVDKQPAPLDPPVIPVHKLALPN